MFSNLIIKIMRLLVPSRRRRIRHRISRCKLAAVKMSISAGRGISVLGSRLRVAIRCGCGHRLTILVPLPANDEHMIQSTHQSLRGRGSREISSWQTYFLRRDSETMQSTSSRRQFVHGAPCSVTLQRTLRARQHWQALEALRFTALVGTLPSNPAADALRFCVCEGTSTGGVDSSEVAMSVRRLIPAVGTPIESMNQKPHS